MASPHQVTILARVVPDGVRDGAHGGESSYRISLALLPDLRPVNAAPKIKVDDWPTTLASKKFRLYAATNPDAPNPDPPGPPGTPATIVEIKNWYLRGALSPGPGHSNPLAREFDHNRAKKADKLWKRLFLADCGSHEQFGALVTTLSPSPLQALSLNAAAIHNSSPIRSPPSRRE